MQPFEFSQQFNLRVLEEIGDAIEQTKNVPRASGAEFVLMKLCLMVRGLDRVLSDPTMGPYGPYFCVFCGESYCEHIYADASGWCVTNRHDSCEGNAFGHEPDTCPCSCHHTVITPRTWLKTMVALERLAGTTALRDSEGRPCTPCSDAVPDHGS